MTKQEKAIELHDRGCNCAQAVACAFAEEIGVPEETLFAAAEGFGLGMGGMEATYQLTREITRQFAEKNHALVCKELKGVETGVVLRSCPDCIRDAVAIAEKVLSL